MNSKMLDLLNGKSDNHILPFMWQHGESEETIRTYMKVINEAGCGAVCLESRPHPDFCGPKWWHDVDIILEEAVKRNMKVWILDDSHFPTGYANGAMKDKPVELYRQSVCGTCVKAEAFGSDQAASENDIATLCAGTITVSDYCPAKFEMSMVEKFMMPDLEQRYPHFTDDRFVGAMGMKADGTMVGLTGRVTDDKLTLSAEDGIVKVWLTGLTRNMGYRRDNINMCDMESVHVQIEAVYEPHFEHYGKYFGNVIEGFFSDEPELGNAHLYLQENVLGTDQDLPFSREIEAELEKRLGADWGARLAVLWENGADARETAFVRYTYMDVVTKRVREDFSYQLGNWCREHGVKYIGHLVEDNNQHARTGSSLGHYFRGLEGQDFGGIDCIGGQVMLQGEDLKITTRTGHHRDGEFYHFCLGKLGGSAAAIDPKKKNEAMCEVFGNYGWGARVKLLKYIADHFMVRGVTEYVPHAFNMKDYPDTDCPPHFYAHGHNPQYRAFGELMRYMNRTLTALGSCRVDSKVAVLYHAEAEWMGKCMFCQDPARVLTERQIEFDFLPMDAFTDGARYGTDFGCGAGGTGIGCGCADAGKAEAGREGTGKTEAGKAGGKFSVNGQAYDLLLIPEMAYIPEAFAKCLEKVCAGGTKVMYVVDGVANATGYTGAQTGVMENDAVAADGLQILETGAPFGVKMETVELSALGTVLDAEPALCATNFAPAYRFLRTMYRKGVNGTSDRIMIVNEGTEDYKGCVSMPAAGNDMNRNCAGKANENCADRADGVYAYDAWNNRVYAVASEVDAESGRLTVSVEVPAGMSVILVREEMGGASAEKSEFGDCAAENGTRLYNMEGIGAAEAGIEIAGLSWTRATCDELTYPAFGEAVKVNFPDKLAEEMPDFSGYAAYETEIPAGDYDKLSVTVTDASDAVEVFLDGKSLGIRPFAPATYVFAADGRSTHTIRVEANTTLEREASKLLREMGGMAARMAGKPQSESGVSGKIVVKKLG